MMESKNRKRRILGFMTALLVLLNTASPMGAAYGDNPTLPDDFSKYNKHHEIDLKVIKNSDVVDPSK